MSYNNIENKRNNDKSTMIRISYYRHFIFASNQDCGVYYYFYYDGAFEKRFWVLVKILSSITDAFSVEW